MRLIQLLNSLRRDNSGVALIEFAYSAPIFLAIGMAGIEVTNMAITRTEVSELALSIADNAARLGQTDNGAIAPTIREGDVDALLQGAVGEAGRISFMTNGRVILSSLEYDKSSDRQFIHWQRCFGTLNANSRYGDDDTNKGLNGSTITGMGAGSPKITADANNAVMFVEVFYEYESLFNTSFTEGVEFNREAAFIVRDDRNLREPDEAGLTSGPTASPCG